MPRTCCLVVLGALVSVHAQWALHQLVTVAPGGALLIRLAGYDPSTAGTKLQYKVQGTPQTGSLFQLSQVYSAYGYNPIAGSHITKAGTVVVGSNNRVYYKRPTPDAADNQLWDKFTFTANDGGADSFNATVTLVPPSGALVGSEFLLHNEGWTIIGNKAAVSPATFEAYSRGELLNHYVYGTDDKVNVKGSGSDDSLWYFQAPPSYLGNLGISYGGFFQFTLALFSGDLTNLNAENVCAVKLVCADCDGPVGKGITLCFPLGATASVQGKSVGGDAYVLQIPLLETAGWTKDPQNSLKQWTPPSKCDIIEVLSRLSGVYILGDWTRWHESVGIDNVLIYNTVGQLPRCANSFPDASKCKCSCGEAVC